MIKTVVNLNLGDPTGNGGKEQGSSQVDQGGRFRKDISKLVELSKCSETVCLIILREKITCFAQESIKEARRLGEEVEKSYRSLDKSKRGYQRAFQVTIDYLGQLFCLRF